MVFLPILGNHSSRLQRFHNPVELKDESLRETPANIRRPSALLRHSQAHRGFPECTIEFRAGWPEILFPTRHKIA